MATIQEIRQQYPQYADLSDQQLAEGLHKKYYSDLPFEDFSQRIGLQAETQEPVAERSSFLGELGRTAAMQTGALVKGATSLIALPVDLATHLYNLGAEHSEPYQVTINGKKETRQAGGLPTLSEGFGNALDSFTPQPRNATERVTTKVVGALGGAGSGIKMGREIGGAVGEAFASKPGAQMLAAGSGATASQLTAEAGGGPKAQMAAGIIGALAPGGSRAAIGETGKRLVRGGEQGRQAVADNISAFEQAGAQPSMGQAAQTRRMQAAESLLAKTPGAAGVMSRRAESQAADLGAGIERQASKLSPTSSAEQAGRKIQRGISGEGGFVENFKAKQEQLYGELDQHIQRTAPVDITNTTRALRALNPTIEGAPNTSQLFHNSRIKGVERAVQKDLELAPAEAQAKLDATLSKIDDLYASRDAARQDAGRFQAFEAHQGNRVHNFSPVPGMPRFPGRYTPHEANRAAGRSAVQDADLIASGRVREAHDLEATIGELEANVAAVGGKLPYEAVKKLRTLVGNEMADSGLMSDVPRSKWKALYGALSSDLETAATTAGPRATAAYARANNFTRAGMRRLEILDSVIDKNGGPEAVFRAAITGNKEGATTLRAVMQSLPKDGQKMVSATVLRRLGRATAGKQDDLGETFSTETFLTNWNSMAPEAKAVLFNRYGPSFRQDMDVVAKVAANLRQGSQVFRNPSGSGQAVTQATTAATFIMSLITGNVGTAAAIGGTVISANLSARLLTNPNAVRWLATKTRAPVAAMPVLVEQLNRSDDPDLNELGQFLQQAQQQQAQ